MNAFRVGMAISILIVVFLHGCDSGHKGGNKEIRSSKLPRNSLQNKKEKNKKEKSKNESTQKNNVSNIQIIIMVLHRYYHYSDSFDKDMRMRLSKKTKMKWGLFFTPLPAVMHGNKYALISLDGKSLEIGPVHAVSWEYHLWPDPKKEIVSFPKPGDKKLKSLEATKIALEEYEKRFPTKSEVISVKVEFQKNENAWNVTIISDGRSIYEKTAIIQVNKEKKIKILSPPK